jgi:hypothetical protein
MKSRSTANGRKAELETPNETEEGPHKSDEPRGEQAERILSKRRYRKTKERKNRRP